MPSKTPHTKSSKTPKDKSSSHTDKDAAGSLSKGFWAFLVGLAIGGGFLGILWAIYSGMTVPHAQTEESGQSYEVVYNGKMKSPTWVTQVINGDIQNLDQDHFTFQQNPKISQNIQSKVTDYEDSGFDIGLLVFPITIDDLTQTFYLSNAAPIVPEFKNGYWKKLNDYIVDKEEKIVVISGPLYIDQETINGKRFVKYQVIGESKVAVPSHFFRIIYSSGSPLPPPEIFVVPNKELDESTPLKSFQLKSDDFEKLSGILLPTNMLEYFFQPVPGLRY